MKKKQTFYKVLLNGASFHGGKMEWSLPENDQPGEWQSISGDIVLCRNGLHLTDQPTNWYQFGAKVYEVEIAKSAKRSEYDNCDKKIAVSKCRLVREIVGQELAEKCGIIKEGATIDLKDGEVVILDGGTINSVRGGTINSVWGGTINSVRGGTINSVRGGTINSVEGGTINSVEGGTINSVRGGTINSVWGGTINSVRGGTINSVRGGTINSVEGGTINSVEGGTINSVWGGTINSVEGGTINSVRGGTINSVWGGTINSVRGGTIKEKIAGWATVIFFRGKLPSNIEDQAVVVDRSTAGKVSILGKVEVPA